MKCGSFAHISNRNPMGPVYRMEGWSVDFVIPFGILAVQFLFL